jgi:hypothetical protein
MDTTTCFVTCVTQMKIHVRHITDWRVKSFCDTNVLHLYIVVTSRLDSNNKLSSLQMFTVFSFVLQITNEAIVSGCELTKSHTRYPLKCFHRPQLIRECNITGLVSYINPLIERACLSLEDHNRVICNIKTTVIMQRVICS